MKQHRRSPRSPNRTAHGALRNSRDADRAKRSAPDVCPFENSYRPLVQRVAKKAPDRKSGYSFGPEFADDILIKPLLPLISVEAEDVLRSRMPTSMIGEEVRKVVRASEGLRGPASIALEDIVVIEAFQRVSGYAVVGVPDASSLEILSEDEMAFLAGGDIPREHAQTSPGILLGSSSNETQAHTYRDRLMELNSGVIRFPGATPGTDHLFKHEV